MFYEGYTSLYVFDMNDESLILIVGILWGRIIIVDVFFEIGKIDVFYIWRFGKLVVWLFLLGVDGLGYDLVVICDDNLILFFEYDDMIWKYKGDVMIIFMSDDDVVS